ncbi:hypothetical protein CYMTET_30850 [Cymbomonas tetramitiformis]|uniref:Uncharacterized protein n=1 Tax=Cymbomonas tetramitiformis TaxID=36881 RepID=A0AAE0KTH6_9CHLO|nr:hypothetical protein CYMTET_30850 [Cymbomonas tetramitiformis]
MASAGEGWGDTRMLRSSGDRGDGAASRGTALSRRSARVARSAAHSADAIAPTDLANAVAPPAAEAIPPQDAQLLRELGINESEEDEEDGDN